MDTVKSDDIFPIIRDDRPQTLGDIIKKHMDVTQADVVNHPSHYTSHPSGIECIQITEHMNFCLGNAIKYIWRAGLKGKDPIQDLQKARFYIDREIKRLGGSV
jgi:hypothetical protein